MPAPFSDTHHAHVHSLQGCHAAWHWPGLKAGRTSWSDGTSCDNAQTTPTCIGTAGLPDLAWASRCLAASAERSAAPLSRLLRAP